MIKKEDLIPFEKLYDACRAICPDKIDFLVESAMDITVDPRFDNDDRYTVIYDLCVMTLFEYVAKATRMSADDLCKIIKQMEHDGKI